MSQLAIGTEVMISISFQEESKLFRIVKNI